MKILGSFRDKLCHDSRQEGFSIFHYHFRDNSVWGWLSFFGHLCDNFIIDDISTFSFHSSSLSTLYAYSVVEAWEKQLLRFGVVWCAKHILLIFDNERKKRNFDILNLRRWANPYNSKIVDHFRDSSVFAMISHSLVWFRRQCPIKVASMW